MAKYKVLRDCHGFRGAYWKEGVIVDVSEGETPPSHFELIDGKPKEPEAQPEPEAPRTFSEINEANDEAKPKTGMMSRPHEPAHKIGKAHKR